jgi:flagellar motor switch protein FliN/FliY
MAEDKEVLNQDEIERLLRQSGASGAASGSPDAATPGSSGPDVIESVLGQAQPATSIPTAGSPPPANGSGQMEGTDVEYLLHQAEMALASIESPNAQIPPGVAPFQFREFARAAASTEKATLDLLNDVELDLTIELGRTHMYLEDVLKLKKGAVVPLDKLAGDPVDIYVNGRLVARGEVLVLNDNFCVRVAELIAGAQPVG